MGVEIECVYVFPGHPIAHQFYPGNPAAMPAAGDFGRVDYPLKLHSYPRDPSTYVPFPTHYAYEPANKNHRHCEVKEGALIINGLKSSKLWFLLAIGKSFQYTKACLISILYANVIRVQGFFRWMITNQYGRLMLRCREAYFVR